MKKDPVRLATLIEGYTLACQTSLHVPYNEHTHHLINAAKFRLMRERSYLINTARGAIVDTEALIEALDDNLAGAGLDVLEGEEFIKEETAVFCECNKPEARSVIIRNAILLRKSNVVYTPHIAFTARRRWREYWKPRCRI